MHFASKSLLAVVLLAGAVVPVVAQDSYFGDWPAGTSPQEVGKRLSEHFVTSPHQIFSKTLNNSEVVAW